MSDSESLVILTSDSNDERDNVALHAIQCKQCLKHTTITEDEATVYEWQSEHYDQTDHVEYWHYKIERSRGRIVHPAKGHW